MDNVKFLLSVSLIFILAACAGPSKTLKKVDPINLTHELSCFEEVIGHVSLASWCEAIPKIQSGCDCDTLLMENRKSVFKSMSLKKLSPVNIKDYYKKLDPANSVEIVEQWFDTGIPLSELNSWVALGLSPVETGGYYDLDVGLKMVMKFLILDIPLTEIEQWVETGIEWTHWPYWIQESITPLFALNLTTENDLNTIFKLKKFISNRKFSPVTSEVKPYTWICSRGNLAGQLINASEMHLTYIQRYRLIDKKGYTLPTMTFYSSDLDMDKYVLSSTTLRNKGINLDWGTCPLIVEQQLQDLYAQ